MIGSSLPGNMDCWSLVRNNWCIWAAIVEDIDNKSEINLIKDPIHHG
jgi:hypothetical protein